MHAAVILTTYNSPEWLRKVIWGYSVQTHRDFQIVIADDGSDWPTASCIAELRREVTFDILHVRHEHRGFRKCKILNEAIVRADANYLIFSDADCIPRADFVAQHVRLAESGCFLSGGCVRLPLELSQAITKEHVVQGAATDKAWLRSHGMPVSYKIGLLGHSPQRARWLNAITTTRATWNGHNSSGWKSDIEAVNGFDERMEYGGLDREMGERLVNIGVRPKQIRYAAVCVHLDHARAYVSGEALSRNREIRRETRRQHLTWTPFGIEKQILRLADFSDKPEFKPDFGSARRAA